MQGVRVPARAPHGVLVSNQANLHVIPPQQNGSRNATLHTLWRSLLHNKILRSVGSRRFLAIPKACRPVAGLALMAIVAVCALDDSKTNATDTVLK